jgi:hypothetical protein
MTAAHLVNTNRVHGEAQEPSPPSIAELTPTSTETEQTLEQETIDPDSPCPAPHKSKGVRPRCGPTTEGSDTLSRFDV